MLLFTQLVTSISGSSGSSSSGCTRSRFVTRSAHTELPTQILTFIFASQYALRSMGYFDITGRLRLTLALTRVSLEIPMVLDRAMRDEPSTPTPPPGLGGSPTASTEADGDNKNGSAASSGELQSRGLLPPRVKGALVIACKVLEKGERWGL